MYEEYNPFTLETRIKKVRHSAVLILNCCKSGISMRTLSLVMRRRLGIWTSRWLGAKLDIAMRPRPVVLNRAGFVVKQPFDTASQPLTLIHLQSPTNSGSESIRTGRTFRSNLLRILEVLPMFLKN
jgi:hypothetical protein